MKKSSLIITILLALAVAVLFVLHFTGIGTGTTVHERSDQETGEIPTGNIVYIRIDSLLNSYNFFQDLQSDLNAKARIVEDDLTKKGRAFENDVNSFRKRFKKGSSQDPRQRPSKTSLLPVSRSWNSMRSKNKMELAEENQVMLNRVLDAIKTYLAQYRVMNNYDLILTTDGSSNTVIDGSPSLDITKDVVAGLNSEYAKSRK